MQVPLLGLGARATIQLGLVATPDRVASHWEVSSREEESAIQEAG